MTSRPKIYSRANETARVRNSRCCSDLYIYLCASHQRIWMRRANWLGWWWCGEVIVVESRLVCKTKIQLYISNAHRGRREREQMRRHFWESSRSLDGRRERGKAFRSIVLSSVKIIGSKFRTLGGMIIVWEKERKSDGLNSQTNKFHVLRIHSLLRNLKNFNSSEPSKWINNLKL